MKTRCAFMTNKKVVQGLATFQSQWPSESDPGSPRIAFILFGVTVS